MFVEIVWCALVSTVGLFIMGTKADDDCIPCYNYPTENTSRYPWYPCYPASKSCNGIFDCENGNDERDCASNPLKMTQIVWCGNDAFQCRTVQKCVPKVGLCDGVRDCPDGSDESAEHAHCDARNMSNSGTVLGLNTGVFIGALLAILAIFIIVLMKIILCLYRHKTDCDSCCEWCTRRVDQEDEETQVEPPRFVEDPPEYSACVNEGFVPDSPNDGQSTSKTLPPSYEDVQKGAFIIIVPGKLESHPEYQRTIDTETSCRERQTTNAQIRQASQVTTENEEVLNHARNSQSLPSSPPGVVPISNKSGGVIQPMAPKTLCDSHSRPEAINTISGQMSENGSGIAQTNNDLIV